MKNIKTIIISSTLALAFVILPQMARAAGEMWMDTVTAMDVQLEQITVTDINLEPYSGTTTYVSATIFYKDASGAERELVMPIANARMLYGLSVTLNETVVDPTKLIDLKGKKVNQLTATRLDRVYSPIYAAPSILASVWIVKADYSVQVAATTATNTTTKTQLSVAQGFVQNISLTDSMITVGKEGINKTIKVTASSVITLNGAKTSLSNIAVGDIVEKAEYNATTGELVNLVVKR